MPSPLLFTGTANIPLAKKIASALDVSLSPGEIVRFADGETHVILQGDARGRDVILIQPTSFPANETVMELLLMAHAARSMHPKRITAVMPFFGYRRQEKQTVPGEALSFQLIALLLKAAGISRVLVVDLHKHRSAKYFKEAGIICKELRGFDIFTHVLQKKILTDFVILAPDKGSIPESERYAKVLHLPLVKVYKHRTKRDHVLVDRMEGNVKGKHVLIIDDEVNTAGTLWTILEILRRKHGCQKVTIVSTHGVLSEPALERLTHPSIQEILLSDTIHVPSARMLPTMHIVSIAPLLAAVLRRWTKLS